MPDQVEWDRKNKVALAIRLEGGQEKPLGNTRLDDAEPEWVDIVDRYPDGYLPQYHALLGNESVFSEEPDGTVVRTWPNADFSEETIRSTATGRVVSQAREILRKTDHIVMEALETRQPIPDDVKQLRNEVRTKRDQQAQNLLDAPMQQVIDHVPDFADLQNRVNTKVLYHNWPKNAPPPKAGPARTPPE